MPKNNSKTSPMAPDEIQKIIDKSAKPLPYIEGFTYFYGRKFFVNKNVLIPRPETEDLINASKSLVNHYTDQLFILDLGTGSGIIAITLAKELTNVKITATDISNKALKIATKNAKFHKVPITFLRSNLFKNLKNQKYHLILANLPYVDRSWPHLNKKALKYEPKIALYAKDHGLQIIKKFLKQATNFLMPGGTIIIEHDPTQFQAIKHLVTHQDLNPTKHSPYITSLTSKTTDKSTPAI